MSTVSVIAVIISSIGLYACGASSIVALLTEVVYIPFMDSWYSYMLSNSFALFRLIKRPAPCGAE